MKTVGIIRNIDVNGRIAIPKQFRDIYNINCFDPIEIYLEDDIIHLRVYQELDRFENIAQLNCKVLSSLSGCHIILTDTEKVLSNKGRYNMQQISKELKEILKVTNALYVEESIQIYENHENTKNQLTAIISIEEKVIGSITMESIIQISIEKRCMLHYAVKSITEYIKTK